ncbi:MAG TPA: hypothetical protein IGS37_13855 [Synechococcales cyanobacterium M55_K2018_004]|nr:hypothetical protein [Synechococcales cyanobacterium M55_K2018_004]
MESEVRRGAGVESISLKWQAARTHELAQSTSIQFRAKRKAIAHFRAIA